MALTGFDDVFRGFASDPAIRLTEWMCRLEDRVAKVERENAELRHKLERLVVPPEKGAPE